MKQIKARIEAKLSKSTRNVIQNVALALLALLVARIAAAAQEAVEPVDGSAQPRAAVPHEPRALESRPRDEAALRQIIVSLTDRKLALIEDGEVVKVYSVAVGKGSSPSPTGEFQIINRLTAPTYYHPHKVIGPGAENPLGTRWIGLNKKGFGIHGTNEPGSIGKAASHGCIRMAKADLEELFTLVRAGDAVSIRGERDEEVAEIFGQSDERQPVTVADASTTAASAVVSNGNQ